MEGLPGEPGERPSIRSGNTRNVTGVATKVPSFVPDSSGTQKLFLVRSYDIPSDDPSAARLANLSWTYDNAVSAVAAFRYWISPASSGGGSDSS